ncbi:MAG TPA: TIGR02679 domain-containing protein [Solirubrobacteraceae bacterium]|nr:TIGR02679 domain-containing protein [Solirubrobacteraceae bacterium]
MADAALDRAILAARDKREQRGAGGDGRLVVADLTAEEALALDGLLFTSRRKPVLPGTTVRVALSQFEAALSSCGLDPRAEYERVGGRSLRDLPAERATQQERRTEFRSWLMAHPAVLARPAVAEWLEQAMRQGRVHEAMRPMIEQALRVLAALPGEDTVQRGVLAARTLGGDPHALDVGTPLHGLTLSLLAAAAGLGDEASPREVWAAWNVLVDPISSNVAALNLPLSGDGPAAAVARAVRGTHVILTYGQLAASELSWPPGTPCFSCENPAVLIAAEQRLGAACPPLVCTAGRPSDAVRRLFSIIHRAGVHVRHHGDFDEAGVQILRDLEDRYGAVAWRFDVAALGRALGQARAPAGTLEESVRRLPRGVAEEMVIDDLLADLRDAGR